MNERASTAICRTRRCHQHHFTADSQDAFLIPPFLNLVMYVTVLIELLLFGAAACLMLWASNR